jgi:hypothetical protein
MGETMKILYSYEGARNEVLEQGILKDIGDRFGAAQQIDAHSGEGGLTTITLALDDAVSGQDVMASLESRPDIVEAAQESFGEGA